MNKQRKRKGHPDTMKPTEQYARAPAGKDLTLLLDAAHDIMDAIRLLDGQKRLIYGAMPHIDHALATVSRYHPWEPDLPPSLTFARRRIASAYNGVEQASRHTQTDIEKHDIPLIVNDLEKALENIGGFIVYGN